jgi:indolepyruvate ferredoxin oxidoreductase beta subunit
MNFNVDPFNLIVCGVGGQGNILISRMIGRILTRKGYYITIGETFGAAQRGGGVHSSVRISKKRYYGPLVPEGKGHFVLSLEPLETLRILSAYGNEDVLTVSNIEPIYPVSVLAGSAEYPGMDALKTALADLCRSAWFLNVTQIAANLGEQIVANIILLGGLLGVDKMPLSRSDVEQEIRVIFPTSKIGLNLKALNIGFEAVATRGERSRRPARALEH